jgi:hypothetical protein
MILGDKPVISEVVLSQNNMYVVLTSHHKVPVIEEVEVLPQLPLNTGEVVRAREDVDGLDLGWPQWPKAHCACPCLEP